MFFSDEDKKKCLRVSKQMLPSCGRRASLTPGIVWGVEMTTESNMLQKRVKHYGLHISCSSQRQGEDLRY